MSEHSTISWTDATWPIVAGCEYVSPGCSNCWAVRDSWRLAHNPHKAVREAFADVVRKTADGKLVWTGLIRPLVYRLDWPLHWRDPKKIFVCSQADLFNKRVPFAFIAAAFGVMAACPHHTFQVLTKHPDKALEFFEWIQNDREGAAIACLWETRRKLGAVNFHRYEPHEPPAWPLENVWFGTTIEDKKRAEERLPHLRRVPAAKRWISAEPLLESLGELDLNGIDWAVGGGESAQTRAITRECDLAWLRELKDQCADQGVAYMNKQLGTRPIWNGISGGKTAHLPDSLRHEDTGRGYFQILPPPGKSSRYKFHEPEYWPDDLKKLEFPS